MEQNEYERIREEIAKWLKSRFVKDRKVHIPWLEDTPWELLNERTQAGWLEVADQILSLKGIRIEAENQDLPFHREENLTDHLLWKEAQQDMLTPKDGKVWVRCLTKDKHGS